MDEEPEMFIEYSFNPPNLRYDFMVRVQFIETFEEK